MEHDSDPGTTVEAALDLLASGDVRGFTSSCTDDVLLEFPFAPPDRPRSVQGREAVAQYLGRLAVTAGDRAVRSRRTYRTTEPGIVVVEMTVRSTVRVGTQVVVRDSDFVAVATVVAGRIAEYRDYWDPTGGRPVVGREAA